MQFILDPVVLVSILVLLFIFSVVELVLILRLTAHYNSLTHGIDKKALMNVMEGIQRTLATHEKNLLSSKNEVQKIKNSIVSHLQHLTLKRFNPFSDTGGDQSFILAILDGNKDGVVITSLHSRENTRFYVKSVKGGVGIDHPLSTEEQKIVSERRS